MNLHATTVRVDGQGVLFLGPSGSGKSALALQLLAWGAKLVADDRTDITRDGARLIADVPAAIAGMIEARGVGLLRAPAAGPTPLALVVDLSRQETARLPQPHSHSILGITLPCLHAVTKPHFAASILLYLRCSISSGA